MVDGFKCEAKSVMYNATTAGSAGSGSYPRPSTQATKSRQSLKYAFFVFVERLAAAKVRAEAMRFSIPVGEPASRIVSRPI